jgi:hypothetical protein
MINLVSRNQGMKTFLNVHLITILFFALPLSAQHQLDWIPVNGSSNQLHADIQFFKTSGNISGDTITAFYAKTNIMNGDLVFYPVFSTMNKKPESFIERQPDILMLTNGGYFGTNVSYSMVLNNYKLHAPNIRALYRNYNNEQHLYYPTRGAFGVTPELGCEIGFVYSPHGDQTTFIYPNPSNNTTTAPPLSQPGPDFPENGTIWQVSEAIGGGPVLLQDGKIITDYTPELFPPDITTTLAPRTAIGYTAQGEIIHLVVDGRQVHSRGVGLQTLAEIMLGLGCSDALNLDGGGSSCIFMGDSLLNKPSDGSTRYIPSVVAVIKSHRKTVDDAPFFIGLQDPEQILAMPHFGFNSTYVYPTGETCRFLFDSLVPGIYRIDYPFLYSDAYEPAGSMEVLHFGPQRECDTLLLSTSELTTSQFIYLGEYMLGPQDTLQINNPENHGLIPVSGIRFTKIAEGTPVIDLDPKVYSGTHDHDEKLKIKFTTESKHPYRRLSKIRVYELYNNINHLYEEKNINNTEKHIDSIEYLVSQSNGDVKLFFTVIDQLGDSVSVSYSVNIDNTPPTVSFGKNSVLSGQVGDTLIFELKVSPAKASRPLKELAVIKNPYSMPVLDTVFVPTPTGDTILYHYPLSRADHPGLVFLFRITDNAGLAAEREYSIQVNNLLHEELPYKSPVIYTGQKKLLFRSDQLSAGKILSLNVFDITGKLHITDKKPHSAITVFDVGTLQKGVYIARFIIDLEKHQIKFAITD